MSVVLVFNAEKKFPLSTCAYYLLSCHCVPQRWVWRDLFYTLHSMFINTDQIPSGGALLQAKLQLSQSLQAQEMLHSPNHVLIIFVAHLVHELHVSVLHLGPTSWSTLCPTFQVRRSWHLLFKVLQEAWIIPHVKGCNSPLYNYHKKPRVHSLTPSLT